MLLPAARRTDSGTVCRTFGLANPSADHSSAYNHTDPVDVHSDSDDSDHHRRTDRSTHDEHTDRGTDQRALLSTYDAQPDDVG